MLLKKSRYTFRQLERDVEKINVALGEIQYPKRLEAGHSNGYAHLYQVNAVGHNGAYFDHRELESGTAKSCYLAARSFHADAIRTIR